VEVARSVCGEFVVELVVFVDISKVSRQQTVQDLPRDSSASSAFA
jgi:hypothetical protein